MFVRDLRRELDDGADHEHAGEIGIDRGIAVRRERSEPTLAALERRTDLSLIEHRCSTDAQLQQLRR